MPIANFMFYNPNRVLFGKNMITQLTNYLPRDKHFIFCYGGGSIKNNGVYQSVVKALDGRNFEEFSGIEANPDYDTLMKCVKRCREIGNEKVYLLAVGGGSIIDGVKFIVAASYYNGDPWQMILTHGKGIEKVIPFSAVLTLPAVN